MALKFGPKAVNPEPETRSRSSTSERLPWFRADVPRSRMMSVLWGAGCYHLVQLQYTRPQDLISPIDPISPIINPVSIPQNPVGVFQAPTVLLYSCVGCNQTHVPDGATGSTSQGTIRVRCYKDIIKLQGLYKHKGLIRYLLLYRNLSSGQITYIQYRYVEPSGSLQREMQSILTHLEGGSSNPQSSVDPSDTL